MLEIKQYDEVIGIVDALLMVNRDKIKDVEFIVGMSRGGLIPAVHIATKLNKPLVTIYIDPKDNIYLDRKKWLHRKDVLLVDDICRSGKTLELAIHELCGEHPPAKLQTLTVFNVNNKKYEEKFCEPDIANKVRIDVKFPWDYDR